MPKRILLILLAAFVAAPFLRPDRSVPAIDPAQDMLTMTGAPLEVRDLVVGACYDCHSYATTYPWHVHITPVNYIMQYHINEGREHLNFPRWDKYAGSRRAGECGEVVQEGEIPPSNYRLMHRHGRLSDAQRQQLAAWFSANLGSGECGAGTAPMCGEEEEWSALARPLPRRCVARPCAIHAMVLPGQPKPKLLDAWQMLGHLVHLERERAMTSRPPPVAHGASPYRSSFTTRCTRWRSWCWVRT